MWIMKQTVLLVQMPCYKYKSISCACIPPWPCHHFWILMARNSIIKKIPKTCELHQFLPRWHLLFTTPILLCYTNSVRYTNLLLHQLTEKSDCRRWIFFCIYVNSLQLRQSKIGAAFNWCSCPPIDWCHRNVNWRQRLFLKKIISELHQFAHDWCN